MSKDNSVTISFEVDKEIYNAYKSLVSVSGETVKDNLIKHMISVTRYGTPNADTIAAIEEVQCLKADPTKVSYGSFGELLEDLNNE